jgi:hypothetical protein
VSTVATANCNADANCVEMGKTRSGVCSASETYIYYHTTTGCKNIAVQAINPYLVDTAFTVLANWGDAPANNADWAYQINSVDPIWTGNNLMVVSLCTEDTLTLNIKVVCGGTVPGNVTFIYFS